MPARLLISAVTIAALLAGRAEAQAPSISQVSPQAVQPGEQVDLTLTGGNLAGASDLWTSFPCESTLSPDVAENGKQNDKVVYRLSVPADAPAGVHGIRVATSRGVSPLKLLVVDDLTTLGQQAENKTLESAQPLTLPIAVDGAVASLGRHYFKFEVAGGQKLSFEVVARRMGSPLDPIIRLLDSHGRELTYNDDEPGLSADPRICYTFDEAGEYVLELRDIRYQGGGNHRFRLRIGDFPCVSVPYPLGVQRGTETTVTFAGPDVDDVEPVAISAPADPLIDWVNVAARRGGGACSGFAVLSLSDAQEHLESEPNNSPEQANRIPLGANINGRLAEPRDRDRFVFSATKGQKFTFSAVTRRQGSPADLYFQLVNAEGAKVAEADDAGTLDASLTYEFPADGDYTLMVEDLHRHGGSEFAYRIEAQPAQPGFSLAATADRINIPAGGTTSITVNATRRNYGGPIEITAVDLPEGATSVPTVIGPGMNSVILTISGGVEAKAGSSHSIRIIGRAKIGEQDVETAATVTEALKGQFSGMPWPPRLLSSSLAAGVAPKPPFTLRVEQANPVFGRRLSTKIKVIAERSEGYDQPIALAVTPEKNGLPGGVSIAVQPIPQGQNEVEIALNANDKAPFGKFTAVLTGTHTKDKKKVAQVVPGIGFELRNLGVALTVDQGAGKLKRGGQIEVKVAVQRNPSLSAPVTLTLTNAATGIAAEAVTIPQDASEGVIKVTANQEAAAGKPEKLALQATASVGDNQFTASAPLDITVE